MAIIKVAPTIFSPIKTIERALAKANDSDDIQVAAGLYKESLQFNHSVSIVGKNIGDTIIEGLIIIPKHTTVLFEQISFVPTAQIYIEGKAIFKHCQFDGSQTSAILSLNNGQLELTSCQLANAIDVGIALFNGSEASITDCELMQNGKTQLLLEKSFISMTNCQLTKSVHGIWLKSESSCNSTGNHFSEQSGTHIIVQEHSTFIDTKSRIDHGAGNGIFATKESNIKLIETILDRQALPQIWLQHSYLTAQRCSITDGKESGLMAREHASVELVECTIAHHKIANIQLTLASRINLESCTLHHCEGVGIQMREQSIANLNHTTLKEHTLAQLLVTEQSIVSLKSCTISHGAHTGISLESGANCTAVNSAITYHGNTAISLVESEVIMIDCDVSHNGGNGILAVQDSRVQIDSTRFEHNEMPHIAGKLNAFISLLQTKLTEGKSFYVIEQSKLYLTECILENSDGVQLEITDQTTAILKRCTISQGKSNAIKALRDSSLTIENTTITQHDMPQIVINDSSIVMKECEVLEGKRNGFIIENNSEAFIQDTFISKHTFPQLWIDLESSVELTSVQLTEGAESDIYVQNRSTLHGTKCIIRNEHFMYHVQAVNYSSIHLNESLVENTVGESFYSENNSTIVHLIDEL